MKIVIAYDSTVTDRIRQHAELPASLCRTVKEDTVTPEHMAQIDVAVMNPSAGFLRQSIKVVFIVVEDTEGTRYREGMFKLISGDTTGLDIGTKFGRVLSQGLPAPSAVEALCFGLGFKGRLNDWMIDRKEDLIVVAQKMEDVH